LISFGIGTLVSVAWPHFSQTKRTQWEKTVGTVSKTTPSGWFHTETCQSKRRKSIQWSSRCIEQFDWINSNKMLTYWCI
jgi:hypothetical protein